MTKAESILRKRYLKRLKVPVLRQKPLDHYIADFYIPSAKLVIEVDGGIHFTEEAKIYDAHRTKLLEEYGIRVIRFTNEQIYSGLKEVSEIIGAYLSNTPCD